MNDSDRSKDSANTGGNAGGASNESMPKDAWDKLTAISPFVSGVVIAAIGLFATDSFNNRKLAEESLQKAHELELRRIETVRQFFPQLTSQEHTIQSAALDSIASLDSSLAISLAQNLGGEGASKVLSRLIHSTEEDIKVNAARALATIIESGDNDPARLAFRALETYVYQFRVGVVGTISRFERVEFGDEDKSKSAMIVVVPGSLAVTPSRIEANYLWLAGYGEVEFKTVRRDEKAGLTVLKLGDGVEESSLAISTHAPEVGEHVLALTSNAAGELVVGVGTVLYVKTDGSFSFRLKTDSRGLKLQGAPITNFRLELVGVIREDVEISDNNTGHGWTIPAQQLTNIR